MFIYSIKVILNGYFDFTNWDEEKKIYRDLGYLAQKSSVNTQKGTKLFIEKIIREMMIVFMVTDFIESDKTKIMMICEEFIKNLGLKGIVDNIKETTVKSLINAIEEAKHDDFLENDEDYIQEFGLKEVVNERSYFWENISEKVFEKSITQKQAIKKVRQMLCSSSFIPELERIFITESPITYMGNPVHYCIASDSVTQRTSMRDILIGMLYQKGRLLNHRCTVITIKNENDFRHIGKKAIDEIFVSQSGGVIVLNVLLDTDIHETDTVDARLQELYDFLKRSHEYKKDVLTIIELERKATRLYKIIMDELHDMAFIKLDEEIVMTDKARLYLRRKAKAFGLQNYSSLFNRLPKSNEGFIAAELDAIFHKWYDFHLRNEVYSQYSNIYNEQSEKNKKPVGDAYKELNELIGLENAKSVIKQAIDFHKAQKLMQSMDLITNRPSMHMIYSGNPGSAKTTVARLLARIMKDNGLLSVGGMVEVGRSDLVGKYVGWTADIVKSKFRRAKGSVLFIDEAYSLLDDRKGLYGDEAINTIVQEMENTREDTVVIFAGYPNEMKEFIDRNPGLKSHITFHIDFPDYTVDELMDIFKLMLKQNQRTATSEAFVKVKSILNNATRQPNFGNGRYVRNLLEQAMMRQASRIMKIPIDEITKEKVVSLVPEDFMFQKLLCENKDLRDH